MLANLAMPDLIRDFLLFLVAIISLLVLIRSANDLSQEKHGFGHFDLRILLSAIILASIVFGVAATSHR